MKKLLLLAITSCLFQTSYASRSRMNSLGQNPLQGSFYIEDYRNFFRNAAHVTEMRNFVVVELETDYDEDIDEENLEGGYFGEFNQNLAYGVFLGHQRLEMTPEMFDVSTRDPGTVKAMGFYPGPETSNPIDIFLAGGSDFKWGLNINYANSKSEEAEGDTEFSSIGVAAGIKTSGGLQVYANWPIEVKAEIPPNPTTTAPYGYDNYKASGIQFGVIYPFDDFTVWGEYHTAESESSGKLPTYKVEGNAFTLGVGRVYEINPSAKFNFDLSFIWSEGEEVEDQVGQRATVTKTILPLTIGVEANATDWLTLRAFVKQNIFLDDYEIELKDTGTTNTDPRFLPGTQVAFGGTFTFGKLKIDGNLGGFGGANNDSLFDASNFYVNTAVTFMF